MEPIKNKYEKNFGHSCVLWEIENFCFETRKRNCLICSPEFFVDKPQVVKWRMKLKTEMKLEEDYYFSLNLERLESDIGVNVVSVELKLQFLNSDKKECGAIGYRSNFENNSRHEIELWNVNYVKDELKVKPLETCMFKILCQMIIHFNRYYIIDGPSDIGLRFLSEDLINLYKSGIYHDVVLRTETEDFYVHKVICAQSNVLADIIEKSESEIVDLSSFNSEAIFNVLACMYSGNMEYVSKAPSILIYDYAIYFKLYAIQNHYWPEKVRLRSTFEVVWHTFVWVTSRRDFEQENMHSSVFKTEHMDTSWKLCYYSRRSDEYASLFADIVEGSHIGNICLSFSIGKNEEILSRKMHLLDAKGKRFGFEEFISKESLHKLIGLNDELNLELTVENHTNNTSFSKTYDLTYISFTVEQFYKFLSEKLFFSFNDGKFADVIIQAEETTIKAHKCILAARSPVLSSLLMPLIDDKLALNIKSNVLPIIIKYIYSGTYDDFKLCDIIEVYKAANELVLESLKEKCSRILRVNINEMPLCDLFDILLFSGEKQDLELKDYVLKHLYYNKDKFIEDNIWKTLAFTKPRLWSEVTAFANSS